MKNVQVIDGAQNCSYSIYQTSHESFLLIFPKEGQDVEFIEDFVARVGEKQAQSVLEPMWKHRIEKPNANGIHGTLFYELLGKSKFYPNKREADLANPAIQRNIH